MQPKLAVVAIHTENLPETAAFYQEIIGLELMPRHGHERVHLKMGDHLYLVIIKGKPPTAAERFPVIAFKVDDLEAAVEELRGKGVEMPDGIEEDSVSRWVMLEDPGGNLVEIAEFRQTPFA
jgi:catechol-2,3-dioxygenase